MLTSVRNVSKGFKEVKDVLESVKVGQTTVGCGYDGPPNVVLDEEAAAGYQLEGGILKEVLDHGS